MKKIAKILAMFAIFALARGEYKAVMGSDPSTAKAYDKNGIELTGDDNVKNNPVNGVS